MFQRILKTSALMLSIGAFALTSGAGCAIGPVGGVLFTQNKFAGEFNSANDVQALKSGQSCQMTILRTVGFGDASAGTAAKQAGINRIASIDHSTMNVLGILYQNYCTIVTGE